MTRFVYLPTIAILGLLTAASALAQKFSVQTNAVSNIAGGSGTATYNGTTASSSSYPGAGSITITNATNAPNLTQATGQVIFTYPVSGGTVTATSYASANLASATLGALGNGNVIGGTVSNEGVTTSMKDTLTFNIPGATSSTITNIGVSFRVSGSAAATGTAYAFERNSGMGVGNALITEGYNTSDNIIEENGWASMDIASLTENLVTFNAVYALTGPSPTVPISLFLNIQCQSGDCDFSHTGAFTMTLPAGVTYTSASGVFLTQPPPVCNYTLSSDGQLFFAAGGSGKLGVTAPTGCDWSVSGAPSWVTFPGASSGNGNGSVNYQLQANTGADRTATLTVAGLSFTIDQEAASITGLNLIGSMPHIAAQENWITTFTMVNNANSSNQARLSLFGSNIDASGSGNPLPLPLSFPQQPGLGSLLGASLDDTLAPFASWIVGTTEATAAPVQTGSAQALATGDLSGFAIFHRISDNQEAVVPLTPGTPNASSYLLSFDNTGGIVTAVAVANVSPQAANIGYVVRNDTGAQIANGSIALPGSGQISFDLPAANGFPATVGIRGTVEFDTPAGGQISVLGIRNTPQATTTGTVTTLTTVPALANVGTGGGSFAFIASGGDGWQTTFVLVNTGGAAAPVSLRFLDPNGNALSLPISYPQVGSAVTTASSIAPTLAAGATMLVQSTGAVNLLTGSAQLTTTGNVSGFVIFRHNGQEAVVPMESRNAPAYILAFDNTSGTATGIALNNVSSAAAAVNIPVVVRDDQGNQLATHTLTVAANGDFSGDLGQYSATLGAVLFPETANIRGTVEFDVPSNSVPIGVIGIRTPAALTYTSLPALVK